MRLVWKRHVDFIYQTSIRLMNKFQVNSHTPPVLQASINARSLLCMQRDHTRRTHIQTNMYLAIAFLPFLAHITSASISLATFAQPNCNGQLSDNIRSNAANFADSSECIATNQFGSVEIISSTQGFTCHVYSDRACANFLDTFSTTGECSSIIGSGVICFSQAAFDNPLEGADGQLSLGGKFVTTFRTGGELIRLGVGQACSNNACDPTNPFNEPADPVIEGRGTFFVTVDGNFDNTDQRDYMSNVLQTAFDLAQTADRPNPLAFLNGQGTLDRPFIRDVPTFGQVVINDARGNNLAQMSVRLSHVESETEGNCESAIAKISEAVIAAIPVVGGVGGIIFKVACI